MKKHWRLVASTSQKPIENLARRASGVTAARRSMTIDRRRWVAPYRIYSLIRNLSPYQKSNGRNISESAVRKKQCLLITRHNPAGTRRLRRSDVEMTSFRHWLDVVCPLRYNSRTSPVEKKFWMNISAGPR